MSAVGSRDQYSPPLYTHPDEVAKDENLAAAGGAFVPPQNAKQKKQPPQSQFQLERLDEPEMPETAKTFQEKISICWKHLQTLFSSQQFGQRTASCELSSAVVIPAPGNLPRVFLVDDYPQNAKVKDFWKYLYTHPTMRVLDLTSPTDDLSSYYPENDGESQQYGNFTVTRQRCERQFFLKKIHTPSEMETVTYKISDGSNEVMVKRSHYKQWTDDSEVTIYELIQTVLVMDEQGTEGTLVHCPVGKGRSTTAVIAYCISRLVPKILSGSNIIELSSLIATIRKYQGCPDFTIDEGQYRSLVDFFKAVFTEIETKIEVPKLELENVAKPDSLGMSNIDDQIWIYWRSLEDHCYPTKLKPQSIWQMSSTTVMPNLLQDNKKVIIASSYPKDDDIYSMWKLILNQSTPFSILDLTHPFDKGLPPPYYPQRDGESLKFDDFTVTRKKIKIIYESSTFQLGKKISKAIGEAIEYTISDGTRTVNVTRHHYTNWQDGYHLPALDLEDVVTIIRKEAGGLFVHCIMGVGRTGTAITAYLLSELMEKKEFKGGIVGLNHLVATLRKYRGRENFVSTYPQYKSLVTYFRAILGSRTLEQLPLDQVDYKIYHPPPSNIPPKNP